MKKLITLLFLLAFAAGAYAQLSLATYDHRIGSNGGMNGKTNSTAATVAAATSYIFKVDALGAYYYGYQIELDDNTGSNSATFTLSASITGNHDYKTITTVSYTGAGTDTTIIGAVSTAVPYRYWKMTVTPSDTIWVKEYALDVAQIGK